MRCSAETLREAFARDGSNAVMTESSPPTIPNAINAHSTSLAARMANVFAAPGEVFDEVKSAPASVANWLVPAVLLALVGIVYAFVLFSQPSIQQQIREQQEQAIEQMVKDGKRTQAEADQALAAIEKFSGPTMMKVYGSFAAVIGSFIKILWWGFVVWMLARWLFKVRVPYMKAVEVAGLAAMISVLGAVVSLFLAVTMGNMFATPSLALLVDDFSPTNKTHLLLGAVNFFNLWLVGVLASGLARLGGVSFGKAALILFGFWTALELVFIFSGVGRMAL